MESRRKRGERAGSTPSRRQKRRTQAPSTLSFVRVIAAATVVAVAATASTVQIMQPAFRQSVHEPCRLDWDDHADDLEERNCFKRMYRMPRETFEKLADLLAPILSVNQHFAEMRTANGAISIYIRLAVALRILAGASYLDVAVMFGLGLSTVYDTLWMVIDAINKTPEVGAFFFPQNEYDCRSHAARFKAPSSKDAANVIGHYSGQKSAYGINVQAMCTADYRFCSMSVITPGSTNDWAAWLRSSLARAVSRLPKGFYILGDAAYPLSDQLLTPYPGKHLPNAEDSFNFHLSQLRVKIEQSFGILVSTWGILWRPLRLQYAGRTDIIKCLFKLHNFLRDEHVTPVHMSEEDEESGRGRPELSKQRTLPPKWHTSSPPQPSRSGETPARAAIRDVLVQLKQWRPAYNIHRNGGRA